MAKGGGAWKVAYADFVTAMMAFFLVMWIVGQDQEKKEAITRYFNNPLGVKPLHDSKHPDTRSNLFSSSNNGEVPIAEEIALGMGRKSYTADDEPSPSTKLIGDHLFSDNTSINNWVQEARNDLRDAKSKNPANPKDAKREATKQISSKIKEEMLGQLPRDVPPIYRDLILESLTTVNWKELAEDMVEQLDDD